MYRATSYIKVHVPTDLVDFNTQKPTHQRTYVSAVVLMMYPLDFCAGDPGMIRLMGTSLTVSCSSQQPQSTSSCDLPCLPTRGIAR